MSIGKKGISVIERMYDGNSNPDAFDFVAGFTAMYNDGKNGKPFGTSLRESNVLNDNQLKLAYNAGEIDRIKETRGGKDKPSINRDKTKTIKRAKKSDWASTDTIWYAPNEKTGKDTIIAYSTTATSDFISALAADNVNSTISEIKDMVNYDVEAKRVLQAYIDSGFGNVLGSDFFGKFVNKTKILQESTTEGRIEAESNINTEKTLERGLDNGQELARIQENIETDKQSESILRTSRADGAERTDPRTGSESGGSKTANQRISGEEQEIVRKTYVAEYSYTKTAEAEISDIAKKIKEGFANIGIESDIYSGKIKVNGKTDDVEREATTLKDGFVLINNATKLAPADIVGHEGFHHYFLNNNSAALEFYETIKSNFDLSSETGPKLIDEISKAYNGKNNIVEELVAFFSGWINAEHDGWKDEYPDCLIDEQAVIDAQRRFIAAVTVKEETEDVHEGIERLCSLQRAHSKSIVAARLRIDKSKEELKQLSDYAERYRKDVNAV